MGRSSISSQAPLHFTNKNAFHNDLPDLRWNWNGRSFEIYGPMILLLMLFCLQAEPLEALQQVVVNILNNHTSVQIMIIIMYCLHFHTFFCIFQLLRIVEQLAICRLNLNIIAMLVRIKYNLFVIYWRAKWDQCVDSRWLYRAYTMPCKLNDCNCGWS